MMLTPVDRPYFQIGLGSAGTPAFPVSLPVLAGDGVDRLFSSAQPAGHSGRFALFRQPGWLIGVGCLPAASPIEVATAELYRDLLSAARDWHLARIWNYVPAINRPGPDGLENYRAFCRGRSLAFERHFGRDFPSFAPAASGVGCDGGNLAVVFAASAAAPRHLENPRQIPAYAYPPQYGPRSPTFSRATVVATADARTIFVSGTSAICGHASVAPDDTAGQLRCTLENLRLIGRACGLDSDLGCASVRFRHLRVYLRHAADYPSVAATLASAWGAGQYNVVYLRSDICRSELNVEIEATVECDP